LSENEQDLVPARFHQKKENWMSCLCTILPALKEKEYQEEQRLKEEQEAYQRKIEESKKEYQTWLVCKREGFGPRDTGTK
jgi:DNA-binding protein H-NS